MLKSRIFKCKIYRDGCEGCLRFEGEGKKLINKQDAVIEWREKEKCLTRFSDRRFFHPSVPLPLCRLQVSGFHVLHSQLPMTIR